MKFPPLSALLLPVLAALSASSATGAEPMKVRNSTALATLRAPLTSGPVRVLLVDDDWSANNQGTSSKVQSPSDKVFRQLAAAAAGNDAKAWDQVTVKAYENGPDIEKLRPYSLILWYTGASYGGNPDNTAVLSIEDEKTVRRYLEEVGGAVVLFSPGYVSKAFGAYGTWEKSNWPFVSEVLGIEGGYGLAQRFEPGIVTATNGTEYHVNKVPEVEVQFSALNPSGASMLFTTTVKSSGYTPPTFPVATSHAYGKGRMVYVGFSFENITAAELDGAFNVVMDATGLKSQQAVLVRELVPTDRPAVITRTPTIVQPADPGSISVRGSVTTAEISWTVPSGVSLVPGGTGSTGLPRPNSGNTGIVGPTTPAQMVIVERLVGNAAPVRVTDVSVLDSKARDAGPLTPGQAVTYRVTFKPTQGQPVTLQASYTPPVPKDPASLTATVQSDNSVLLSWPAVPGVTRYEIGLGENSNQAKIVVQNATQWRSAKFPATGRPQYWSVHSLYDPEGTVTSTSTWARAQTQINPPTPTKLFLTQPAGNGSYADSVAHYRTKCSDAVMPGSLCKAPGFLNGATNWEGTWNDGGKGQQWPAAVFDNLFDLGSGRRVNCVPRAAGRTLCWATSHGTYMSSPVDPSSLSLIIMQDDGKAYFATFEYQLPDGEYELPKDQNFFTRGGWEGNWIDHEHSLAMRAELYTGAALDSQGRKQVPHACLSCHGGSFDQASKMVVGASLLPVVPARVRFNGSQNTRSWQEEEIRRINHIVLQSNPAPAIVAQINAMYNGQSGTVGRQSSDAGIPSGWQSQRDLYNKVFLPYCSGCHFSQRGAFTFRDFASFQQHKSLIQNSVCRSFTMPHAEPAFRSFWVEKDGDTLLPDKLMAALGYGPCLPTSGGNAGANLR